MKVKVREEEKKREEKKKKQEKKQRPQGRGTVIERAKK